MKRKERIVMDPKILAGEAIIKNTRISVEFILELLVNRWSFEQILENYPQLEQDDILAAIESSMEHLKLKIPTLMTKGFYYTLEDEKIREYMKLTTQEKLKWLEEINAIIEMVLRVKEKQFRNKLSSTEI
jgi:uncharacterized protein (DUF433 family)